MKTREEIKQIFWHAGTTNNDRLVDSIWSIVSTLQDELTNERTTGRQEWERLQLDQIKALQEQNEELNKRLISTHEELLLSREERNKNVDRLKEQLTSERALREQAEKVIERSRELKIDIHDKKLVSYTGALIEYNRLKSSLNQ